MREHIEALEDIDDTVILNKLKGSFRESKQVPRFRERVDVKRFKSRGFKHDTVVNGTDIEIKGGD